MTGDGRTLKGTVVEFSDIQPLFKLIGKENREQKVDKIMQKIMICNFYDKV